MSLAKPILEYVTTIRTRADIAGSAKTFKRLMKYHKPYVHFFALIAALAVARAYVFTLEPLYTAQIIDQVIVAGNYDLLLGLVLAIMLAVGVFGALNYAITYLQGYTAQLILRDVRSDYYSSLQRKSFTFFDSTAVGDLVSRATMDLRVVEEFLKMWTGTLTNAVFTGILVYMVMYSINPAMSVVAVVPIILIFYLTVRLQVTIRPLFRKMMLILGRLGAYVQQNILGMKVVRIFRREAEMEDGFKQVEEIYVDTAISAGKVQSKYMPSAPAVLTLGIALVYLYGGNLIASPSSILTIGQLTLFARYMMRLSFPLRDLSNLIGSWVNAAAGLERVHQIMDLPAEVADRPDAKEIFTVNGEVEFRNVTFGYAKDRPVLRNVSFKVQQGERIAILGATGSGKTSLIYLIPRFYDVDSGAVMIDGMDVRDFKLSSLRRQIGIVMQDVFIFSGTIRDNIAFGKPEASLDEVITAAKLARIHDFVETLPNGYDTVVGERGITLSGGQRQRLTIARALLTNPRILILDDSLSFVDAKTEQEIQEAIEEAMKGRTCFVIAQRLSTIKNADRIMVLDDGQIAEFGTHSDLMAKNGIYRRIYETQFLEKAPEAILATAVHRDDS
jgi:ABC-type multidrug transport system fused ATPase/permease subunit